MNGVDQRQEVYEQEMRVYETRVTAVALALIALCLASGAMGLLGVGTHVHTMHLGMGTIPYACGALFMFLAFELCVASAVYGAKLMGQTRELTHLSNQNVEENES